MGRPAQRAQALRARLQETLERDRVHLESGDLQQFEAEVRKAIERFFPGAGSAAKLDIQLQGDELQMHLVAPTRRA